LLIGMGFLVFISGILSDLISVNRKLLEDVRQRAIYLEATEVTEEARGRAEDRPRDIANPT
jgi:hypothetical protein